MKEKLTALDIELVTSELDAKLVNHRLSNIYNIAESNRQFLLKFNKPDSKYNVVVTCGLKVHITDFTRPTPPQPSVFIVKLRNFLKSRRLTGVKQVKKDRVVVLQFSDGAYYLVLEFFSAGNVFLLDSERKILVLQRVVEEHENNVGSTYKLFDETLFSNIENNVTVSEDLDSNNIFTKENIKSWIEQEQVKYDEQVQRAASDNVKSKKVKVLSISKLLFLNAPYLSSPMINKYLLDNEIASNKSCLEFLNEAEVLHKVLKQCFVEYQHLLKTPIDERVGYIVSKKNDVYRPGIDDESLEYIYDKFEPFPPFIEDGNKEKVEIVTKGYNSTIDNFFSTIESSKYALRIATHEQQAAKKIESTRLENEQRLKQFENIQSLNEQKGNAIIQNADMVENCKNAVQGLLDQQMDWEAIEKLIKMEQIKKNEIAKMIKLPLDLKNNKINVILPIHDYEDKSDSDSYNDSSSDSDSDSDSDNEGTKSKKSGQTKSSEKSVTVVIDLSLSAFANSSSYFSIKKQTKEKQSKTEKNQKIALKNISERINKNLQSKLKEQHDVLKKIRTQYFFEKYFWFISSEGYLVLMGKSDQETDLIFSKYIDDDDLYVTNNVGGKFTQVFIKNPEKHAEIPPNTLMQASIFSISGGEAWNKKLNSVGTWYCSCKNLSKFHPTDNLKKYPLDFGKFHIIDDSLKINLPPAQMVMGLAFLFKIKTENDGVYVEEPVQDETLGEHSETKEAAEQLDPQFDEQIISEVSMNEITSEITNLDVNNDNESDNGDSSDVDDEDLQSISLATDIVTNMNKNVRGKKGKLKKMQRKYRDQDDDERSMRLELLGTLRGVSKEQAKEQEQLDREQHRLDSQQKRKARIEKQAMRFTESKKPKVFYDKILQELKGTCDSNDEILEVIPMFAPWNALSKYKYKIKIQPGNNKKLKSCNEILNYFNKRQIDAEKRDKEMMWPNEHELIQSMKDQELVPVFCVDKIKVNLPSDGNSNSKGKKSGSANDKKQKKKKK